MDADVFPELLNITSSPDNFYPSGNTAIGETLEIGTEMLAQSGTIFKSLIVISDGENTSGVSPITVMDAIVKNKNNKTTTDFPVSTSSILVSFVGFDIDTDNNEFSKLHDIGARVMSAGNKIELNETLKNVFLADITKLESK